MKKSGIIIIVVVVLAALVALYLFLTYRSKLAESQKPKSWWEGLGIEFPIPGLGDIGLHL